ncbi:MAG: CHASE domain-containing protein [Burkholderiaceae bacterium]|nr:CHASE domain-containing protein [Burkholderiaceae bacterium]
MRRPAAPLTVVLLTALVYGIVGAAAVQLAVHPGHAVAVYPSAGIALAVALVYGWPALLGAALGAAAVNVGLMVWHGQPGATELAAGVAIGAGAAAQAAFGRALVRRWVSQPLVLAEFADVVRFYLLGGPVACLVSASVAHAALVAAGQMPLQGVWVSWWTWWLGDVLGVLLAAPVVLALVGRPREEWAPRRLTLVVPMLLTTAMLAGAIGWAAHAHGERVRTAFERDAWSLADALDAQLRRPLDALQAMHGLFDSQQHIDPVEMQRATAPWLRDQPFIAAIGYSARVDPADVADFEARARAEGPVTDYRVFAREDAQTLPPSPYGVVAIRLIEPLATNRPALGVDAMTIRAARAAIQRAAATGQPAATAGFRLTQATGDETGIVIYRALYQGDPRTDAERRAAFTGVVFVTLRLETLVADMRRQVPMHLAWCLVDLDPGAERARLAGAPGCEAQPRATLRYLRNLVIGPRVLQWQVSAEPSQLPGVSEAGTTLFATTGLIAAGLLGALLLTVSGRQRRIELAVTERTADLRAASLALQESQARLRNIVDHVPIGVIYADANGRLREANPGLLAMLGRVALPEPPPTLPDWVHAEDRAEVEACLHQVRTGEQPPARMQVRLVAADGSERTVRLDLSPLRGPDGQLQRLVGVVEDIGEHLQLEASERARRAAEASSQAKSEFVGRMSHELRTPLNAMLGFSQLLSRDSSAPLAAHQRRWIDQVQDAGWHLLNMINDTLDLSMIESGALRLTPVALDPRALLEATLSMIAASADRRGLQVAPAAIAPDVPPVLGDETRVKQILTNLLSNAVKYNVDGGRIAVQVEVDPGTSPEQVVFRVSDTGIGLSAEQLERLFHPFDRLGRESSGVEGTGIGLVISRRLAECMGGSLTASGQVGRGSVFELRLPRAATGPDETPRQASPASDGRYRQRRVHYVEDNETNVVLMRGMLAQRPQIALSVSTMGLDALAAVRIERPDLLLLDMHLPDIDGLDLLTHLKADDGTAGIPVIVLSADATPERVARALDAGAEAYLPKPLNLGELLQHVDALLEQGDTVWSE